MWYLHCQLRVVYLKISMQIGCLVYNIFVIGTFTVCVDWVAELVYVD